MDMQDKATLSKALGKLFRGFHIGRIDPQAVPDYVEALATFDLDAALLAIERFGDGLVPTADPHYPPSRPELVTEARAAQSFINFDRWKAKTEFVAVDSPKWRALVRTSRPKGMPSTTNTLPSGERVEGWWVPKDEVRALPPLLVEEERALLARTEPDPRVVSALPKLRGIK